MNPDDLITEHIRIVDTQKRALKKLGLLTVRDLLYHLPARYENIAESKSVNTLQKGDDVVVYGTFSALKTRKTWNSRRAIAEGWLSDGTGRIKVMWFNQPYVAKMITEGIVMKVSGTIGGTEGKLFIGNPEVEPAAGIPLNQSDSLFEGTKGEVDDSEQTLFALYPESKGITSKWFRHAIARILKAGVHETLPDPIPEVLRERYHLPLLATALVWIHQPKKLRDSESARKRFAFEEIFAIQLAKHKERAEVAQADAVSIELVQKNIEAFMDRFPFALTRGQLHAIKSIFIDFTSPGAMSRLLEGDVGSGKTAVAATTAFAVVESAPKNNRHGRLQVAYMAPTEILAKQHFESFIEYFHHMPVTIGLLTGSGCQKFPSKVDPTSATSVSRAQLLRWVSEGDIHILIGTHALIQKTVEFKNLGYIIIDEQHRFGTRQRHALRKKDDLMPHLLSMTATPIPRTLALTLYGDLDLTVLDEMPMGRKPVKSFVIKESERAQAYTHISNELTAGRQAYVICPRIDEPDPDKLMAVMAASAIETQKKLQLEVFPNQRIGLVHSKLTPKEKDAAMLAFVEHTTDILVATSVVEVGVNVPNATIIMIEGAERFGLAQLHQLRGRVIRSNHQSYCYFVTSGKSQKAKDRLKALTTAKNGFELAEFDLKQRGAGELYGRAQSGLSDLGMNALKNLKLVEAARTEARALIDTDPLLSNYPLLQTLIAEKLAKLHFE